MSGLVNVIRENQFLVLENIHFTRKRYNFLLNAKLQVLTTTKTLHVFIFKYNNITIDLENI